MVLHCHISNWSGGTGRQHIYTYIFIYPFFWKQFFLKFITLKWCTTPSPLWHSIWFYIVGLKHLIRIGLQLWTERKVSEVTALNTGCGIAIIPYSIELQPSILPVVLSSYHIVLDYSPQYCLWYYHLVLRLVLSWCYCSEVLNSYSSTIWYYGINRFRALTLVVSDVSKALFKVHYWSLYSYFICQISNIKDCGKLETAGKGLTDINLALAVSWSFLRRLLLSLFLLPVYL